MLLHIVWKLPLNGPGKDKKFKSIKKAVIHLDATWQYKIMPTEKGYKKVTSFIETMILYSLFFLLAGGRK